MVTFDDITEDNYVEYLAQPSGKWLPAKFSESVVQEMIETYLNVSYQQLSFPCQSLQICFMTGTVFCVTNLHSCSD